MSAKERLKSILSPLFRNKKKEESLSEEEAEILEKFIQDKKSHVQNEPRVVRAAKK